MKVAVCHDRLTGTGGGERVAITLAKAFNADLFVAKYTPEKTYEECKKLRIKEIAPIPDPPASQFYPLIRMHDAWKFSRLKELREYDLLFTSGMWAFFASKQNLINIWYCHSPNRGLYDLREEIPKRYNVFWRLVYNLWADFWTSFDQKYVKKVKKIVVNSINVAKRVKRFYNRDAEVVHPSVRVDKFYHKPHENYYLSVQRIMPEKRVGLQLKIFEHLPNERLVIVGKAEYGTEYQRKISQWIERMPNVEWLERVSDEELRELYARCKAVIQTSIDEDFGLIPIEAMASGKPCVAVNEGGFRESIVHGKTGLLIDEPYLENFVKAIKNFDDYVLDPKECMRRSRDFSEEEFIRKIRKIVNSILV